LPNFPKFAQKFFGDKRSCKFAVAVGTVHYTFLYHVAIDLKIEKVVLEAWVYNPTEKRYARLCKNIVRSQLSQ